MTTEQMVVLQKLTIYRWSCALIPVSVGNRYVKAGNTVVHSWKELRVFGVLIAMWGTIG